jgi:hypothetical protein
LHHSATNRRPPLGCMSPVTIDSSDGDWWTNLFLWTHNNLFYH